MTTRIFISFLLIASAYTSQAQLTNNVSVTGSIINSAQPMVVLYQVGANKLVPLDTFKLDAANLGAKQKFHFSVDVNEPNFFQISQGTKDFTMLVLSPKDKLKIDLDGKNLRNPLEISGSWETERLYFMTNGLSQYDNRKQEIEGELRKVYGTPSQDSVTKILTTQYKDNEISKKSFLMTEMKKAPSLSGLVFMDVIKVGENMKFYKSYVPTMVKKYPNNIYVKSLSQQYQKAASSSSIAVGTMAPEINLKNPDGKFVKLSSLRGDIVLIDFWASWCGPCRRANPHVVGLYKKYNPKGFEIYGVSLDKDRAKWLQAIASDNLTWTHVSDLKGWQSEGGRAYNVSSIPQTVLIDKKGKIIAIGLRGAQLDAKLKELYGF